MKKMSMTASTDATAGALPPRLLAERLLRAIKGKAFDILRPGENTWRNTANTRLADIRMVRNPALAPPAISTGAL